MRVSPLRQLPLVLGVTLLVCVLPAFVAPRLVTADGIRSVIASIVLTLALSAAAVALGTVAWSRRRHEDDTLFADLLLGRWLGVRWREQRLRRMRARLLREPPTPTPGRLAALARVGLLLEARERNVYGHSRRVARYAQSIARGLHLPPEEVETIRQAALVHDIGKIYTPKEILDKPGRLTDAEFAVIKRHPADGADLLEASAGPEIRTIVRHHHERLDGNGYPDGLAGDRIPMGARIIAVADTFDALTSTRAYRTAATHRRALEVLRTEAGSQLDGDAVAAFLRVYSTRRPVVLTAAVGSVAARLADRAAAGLSQAGAALQAVPTIGAAIAVAGTPALGERVRGLDAPAARQAASRSAPAPAAKAKATATAERPTPARPARSGAPAERRARRVPARRSRTTTPAVSTPAVTTPTVATPQLATPVAGVPAVSVPTVTVSPITVPAVDVPAVSLP
ncbi:MAG: HD-GYP domain-containing protein [Solirubrobacteraceae bacterium]